MVGIFIYKCSQNEEYASWFRQRPLQGQQKKNLMYVPQIHTEHSKRCIKYCDPTSGVPYSSTAARGSCLNWRPF